MLKGLEERGTREHYIIKVPTEKEEKERRREKKQLLASVAATIVKVVTFNGTWMTEGRGFLTKDELFRELTVITTNNIGLCDQGENLTRHILIEEKKFFDGSSGDGNDDDETAFNIERMTEAEAAGHAFRGEKTLLLAQKQLLCLDIPSTPQPQHLVGPLQDTREQRSAPRCECAICILFSFLFSY